MRYHPTRAGLAPAGTRQLRLAHRKPPLNHTFHPLPEPQGLRAIKAEIGQRWPMTELLDVLKETALDTGFLNAFETSASRVALSRDMRDRRLLLCLYGLGTNAGLKRVA